MTNYQMTFCHTDQGNSMKRITAPIVMIMLLVLAVAPLRAQTGPDLMLVELPEVMKSVDTEDIMLTKGGHSKGTPFFVGIWSWDSYGKFVIDDAHKERGPIIGYNIYIADISSSDPRLPERLEDYNAAVGFVLNENETEKLTLSLGGGYAGTWPFSEGDGWFGKADLIYTHATSDTTGWTVVANYDGNRTFLPDIPLPALSYYDNTDEKLQYVIGVPRSSLRWQIADNLVADIVYLVPLNPQATITLSIRDNLQIFGAYRDTFKRFNLAGSGDDNRHIFFKERRLEAGAAWQINDNFELTVAGGWAFDRQFSTGFDVRSLDNEIGLSSEPYIRFAVGMDF